MKIAICKFVVDYMYNKPLEKGDLHELSIGICFRDLLSLLGCCPMWVVEVLSDEPVSVGNEYVYKVKLISKNYYLFGFKIYTKIL